MAYTLPEISAVSLPGLVRCLCYVLREVNYVIHDNKIINHMTALILSCSVNPLNGAVLSSSEFCIVVMSY